VSELGKALADARKSKNMTMDELQAVTKIQKRYLTAVEEGNFDLLPGKFYARAFVKTYAEAVGLDPNELFEEYKADLPDPPEGTVRESLTRTTGKNGSNVLGASKFLSFLPKVLLATLIIGLLVTFWFVLQKYSTNGVEEQGNSTNSTVEIEEDDGLNEENDDKGNENSKETDDDSEKDEVDDKETSKDPEPPKPTLAYIETKSVGKNLNSYYELKNTSKLVVKITFAGKCYINIQNGKNESFYDDVYNKGQVIEHDFTDAEMIYIRFGATQKANVTINGEPFEFHADKDVQNIYITKISNE
jgi:cytoskeletal protein RodZ